MMTEVKEEYYPNGNIACEYYCKDGEYHREDGSAMINYYENGNILSKRYLINGVSHREDGPAYINYYSNGNIRYKEYWINGEYLVEEEWYRQLSIESKLKIAFGIDDD